jgi:hypothetical protein
MPSVIVHISNEDPVMGEIDALPGSGDSVITLKNPRRKDGKDVNYLEANVSVVLFPLAKVNFIEVVSVEAEEEIITFVRE